MGMASHSEKSQCCCPEATGAYRDCSVQRCRSHRVGSITRASFKCKVVHWSGARFPTEYGLDMDTSWLHLTCRHGVCDVSVITLEHISPRLPRLGWSTSSGNASHASVLMALCSLFSSFVWPVQCLHSACTVPATVPAWRNPNEMQNRVRVKRISSN